MEKKVESTKKEKKTAVKKAETKVEAIKVAAEEKVAKAEKKVEAVKSGSVGFKDDLDFSLEFKHLKEKVEKESEDKHVVRQHNIPIYHL